jgi:hypothetical protein
MGTYITPGQTLEQTIAELLAPYTPAHTGGSVVPIAHQLVAEDGELVLWVVQEHQGAIGTCPVPCRWIMCFLIRAGGSGYKPMSESAGPCYYAVPREYLDLVPDPRQGYSTEWRAKVVRTRQGGR